MENSNYYVYILYSHRADKYYVGQTKLLTQRIKQHNHPDNTGFTRRYQPWN